MSRDTSCLGCVNVARLSVAWDKVSRCDLESQIPMWLGSGDISVALDPNLSIASRQRGRRCQCGLGL